ncbi:MAG TPA: hypothetical protein VGB90_06770 [Alphaproteobacteria bacterium]
MTDVAPEVLMAIGAAAAMLPLYAALDRVLRRLRAVERRLADASALSPPACAAEAASARRRPAGEACAQWRTELAALEADGRAGSPKADALRRRLREIGGNDGLPGA